MAVRLALVWRIRYELSFKGITFYCIVELHWHSKGFGGRFKTLPRDWARRDGVGGKLGYCAELDNAFFGYPRLFSIPAEQAMVRLEDGAQESEIGDAEQDLLELMGQMMPRIRRLLAQQHLKTEENMSGLHIADLLVRERDKTKLIVWVVISQNPTLLPISR
jgi:hypothetical protein